MIKFLVAFQISLAAIAAARDWTPGQAVKTTSGILKGRPATRPGFSQVSEYIGVPFAEPPQGALRWLAPKPYKSNDTIDATKWKDDCSQPTSGAAASDMMGSEALRKYGEAMGGGDHKYTEDCLGLNIWTKPQTGEDKKAVLLWIHGGAFSSGTPHAPYMDGSRYAEEQDVILVSTSYRINIMGFPNAPGLPDVNPGLLDMRLAIEWVRDNIANFGGDPKRITIFGESAGGAAVDGYAYAWKDDPIIKGVIAQSGAAGMGMGAANAPHAAWYKISEELGCGGRDAGEKTVECMRGKSYQDINKKLGAMSTGLGGTPFSPTPDGKTWVKDAADKGKSGEFARVPLLIGNTDFEAGLGVAINAAKAANAAKQGSAPKAANPMGMMGDMMTCMAGRAANFRVKNGVPAWRYRYMGIWDNVSLGPGTGAYHSSDVPAVFGTTELRRGNVKDSEEEAKTIKMIMTAWASFAKDPVYGLQKLTWPVYDETRNTLIRLGYNNQSALNLGKSTEYDGSCGLMNAMQGPTAKSNLVQ